MLIIITTILLARRIFHSDAVGIIAGLLLAIPPINVTLYTTVSLGGYGEALLLGNILLLLSLQLVQQPDRRILYLAWGFLAGLAFWTFGLTLIYTIPSALYILWSLSRQKNNLRRYASSLGLACIGGLVGLLPILVWATTNNPQLLFEELTGSAIGGVFEGEWVVGLLERIRNFLLFGPSAILGFRAPWEVQLLARPLFPLSFIFWTLVLARMVHLLRRKDESRPERMLLAGVMIILFLGFVLTPFGGDPSGRYFVPLYPFLVIFAAEFIQSLARGRFGPVVAYGLLGGILLFHAWGTLEKALRNPPGITTQFDVSTWIDHQYDADLISFLEEHDELTGYTNYWVTYPIAFQSNEELLFTPLLPYHLDLRYTSRDNRYEPYNNVVESANKVAYITLQNQSNLNTILRITFRDQGISWDETNIGDYVVFHNLSKTIRPSDMEEEWAWLKK